MKRLDGTRCLITGGSRGLGRELCLAFAREGARVAFTYRSREDAADETRRVLGEGSLSFRGDVSDAAHAEASVAACVKAWGGLDLLVNNAAITQVLPIALLLEKDWDRIMAVNVKGPYLFARAALKPMIRARRGHILNVGSFGSDRVVEAPVHYAASKAALAGLTFALAREVGRYGVRVNLLVPGLLERGMGEGLPGHRREEYRSQAALKRLGTPAEVSEQAVWLASEESALVTGARIVVDGGL